MAGLRFEYDDSLVTSCASSTLAQLILQREQRGTATSFAPFNQNDVLKIDKYDDDEPSQSCFILFDLHSKHFYGSASEEEGSSERKLSSTNRVMNTDENKEQQQRLHRFIANTIHVHNHNSKNNNSEWTGRHSIGLNQFSDLEDDELPLSPLSNQDLNVMNQIWNFEDDLVNDLTETMISLPLFDLNQNDDYTNQNVFVRLHNEEDIAKVAADFLPYRTSYLEEEKEEQGNRHDRRLKKHKHHKHHNKSKENNHDSALELLEPQGNIHDQQDNGRNVDDGKTRYNKKQWKHHINWATDENPDGVGIVHPPYDQGYCGSCWAFSATGTIEASVSRRAAYNSFMESTNDKIPSDKDDYEKAVQKAKAAESLTLQDIRLSVQELLDCDTSNDQACIGGNPLLAFYFIHRYGLTSWDNYPYHGHQERCQLKLVRQPIVTVQSWGVLPQENEKNMEVVLRDIGPIAVGLHGADPSFLMYRGGIYQNVLCPDDRPNHALLIVGMGEETDPSTGVTVKYWICRNTWGSHWGENGYIRIQRNVKNVKQGICGLAKTPSIALGAQVVANPKKYHSKDKNHADESYHGNGETVLGPSDMDTDGRTTTTTPPTSTTAATTNSMTKILDNSKSESSHPRHHALKEQSRNPNGGSYCTSLFDFNCMMEYHRGLLFGLISLFTVSILVVLPLTTQCRSSSPRRRRKQRMRGLSFSNSGNVEHPARSPAPPQRQVETDDGDFYEGTSTIATEEAPLFMTVNESKNGKEEIEKGETSSLLGSSSVGSGTTKYYNCMEYGSALK